MPSNKTFLCIPCRKIVRQMYGKVEWVTKTTRWRNYSHTRKIYSEYITCPSCKGRMESMGKNWAPPKKNNGRAWKRIQNGDYLWDHRRLKRRGGWNVKNYRTNNSPDMGG